MEWAGTQLDMGIQNITNNLNTACALSITPVRKDCFSSAQAVESYLENSTLLWNPKEICAKLCGRDEQIKSTGFQGTHQINTAQQLPTDTCLQCRQTMEWAGNKLRMGIQNIGNKLNTACAVSDSTVKKDCYTSAQTVESHLETSQLLWKPNAICEKLCEQDEQQQMKAPAFQKNTEYQFNYNTQISSGLIAQDEQSQADAQQKAITRIQCQARITFASEQHAQLCLERCRAGQLNEQVKDEQRCQPMSIFESVG
jgi:hypothetical protein